MLSVRVNSDPSQSGRRHVARGINGTLACLRGRLPLAEKNVEIKHFHFYILTVFTTSTAGKCHIIYNEILTFLIWTIFDQVKYIFMALKKIGHELNTLATEQPKFCISYNTLKRQLVGDMQIR